MHKFLKFIFAIKLYMFRTVPLYIIRSFYNNNIYLLQLGFYPVAVVILHVYKI